MLAIELPLVKVSNKSNMATVSKVICILAHSNWFLWAKTHITLEKAFMTMVVFFPMARYLRKHEVWRPL